MTAIFESKAFAAWKKSQEHELKQQSLVIQRLDNLSGHINNLAKALSRR